MGTNTQLPPADRQQECRCTAVPFLQSQSRIIFNGTLTKAAAILILFILFKREVKIQRSSLKKKNLHCHFIADVGMAWLIELM